MTVTSQLTIMRIWIQAARPKTLWAAISPVLIGISLSLGDDQVVWLPAVLAMLAAILIQIATNFYNDYADFEIGADTTHRVGPERAVQSGKIDSSAMRNAAYLTFVLAAIAGTYLMIRGGWPIVIIGATSILCGILYTRGRYSLSYLGIADVFVFIFFGPIAVAGTYYVQTLSWPPYVWAAGIAPGLLSVAILMINNIRDIETDAAAGKKTLVVRLGRRFGHGAWTACILGALCVPLSMVYLAIAPTAVLLSGFVLFPALGSFRTLVGTSENTPELLNPVLGQTAGLLLIYSVLFSIGWNLNF